MTLNAPADTTFEPGTPEHTARISASKIGSIIGVSRHTSAVSLAAQMLGLVEPEEIPSHVLEYGQDREEDLIRKFSKMMPEHPVLHSGDNQKMWVHPENDRYIATPDGTWGDALVEAKTSRIAEDWGKEGTADIPAAHFAQVGWAMFVTGADTCYVIADVMMEYKLFVVTWEDVMRGRGDVPPFEDILARVQEFEAGLAFGELPDWDGSDSTYQTVRRMHPEINGETVEVPEDIAVGFRDALILTEKAETALTLAKTKLAAAMGKAQKAVLADGTKVAGRQVRGKAAPFVVADRSLKNLVSALDSEAETA